MNQFELDTFVRDHQYLPLGTFAKLLHNKIVGSIVYDVWQYRESDACKNAYKYATCTNILAKPSLKQI